MEYLFSERRLKIRAELFFEKAVPALAKMAENHDYKHFILYSELLPEHHRKIIFEAAEQHAFLVPVEWNQPMEGPGIEIAAPLIEADLKSKFDPDDPVQSVVWFRLDDDDVLAADYLTKLERYRIMDHVGMAISFGLGLTAYKGEHELVKLREYHHPKSAQGMAFVTAFDPATGQLSFVVPGPHTRVDLIMPTILDSREHMFFQIRHADQDSSLSETPHQRIAASLARLDKLAVISEAEVDADRWPSVIDDIRRGAPRPLDTPTSEGPLQLTEDTKLTFELDQEITSGLVEFEFDFESPSNLKGGFAEVLFDLHGVDGVDLRELGLRNSPRFGWCRQAWSKSVSGTFRHSFLLPEGASISSLTLLGKNSRSGDIFVRLREPRVVAVHAPE